MKLYDMGLEYLEKAKELSLKAKEYRLLGLPGDAAIVDVMAKDCREIGHHLCCYYTGGVKKENGYTRPLCKAELRNPTGRKARVYGTLESGKCGDQRRTIKAYHEKPQKNHPERIDADTERLLDRYLL
ncbi:MAG: hypothetical protein Q3985_06665 [Eubacteriales bacterium]|nr:hypothetical protein [Eubacteriales bacterium]